MARHRSNIVLVGLVGLALALAAACDPPPPPPPTITVTTTVDGPDAVEGDGVCEMTPGTGDCSLRAAIGEANGLGRADLTVPAGTYPLPRASSVPVDDDANRIGDLDVTGAVRINRGSPVDVVLVPADPLPARISVQVHPGGSLVADGITVQWGGFDVWGVLALDQSTVSGGYAAVAVNGDHGRVALTNTYLEGGIALEARGGARVLAHHVTFVGGGETAIEAAPEGDMVLASSAISGWCSGGAMRSAGYVIAEVDSTCFLGGVGDQMVEDLRLDAPATPGAPRGPKRVSPLRNAIPVGANECGAGFVEDRYGNPRPAESGCDVGALERQPDPSVIQIGTCTIRLDVVPPDDDPSAVCPGADLRGADLSGLSLWLPDLAGADLTGADLTGASIIGPSLYGTDLTGADLRDVDVLGGVWDDVALVGADLRGSSWVEVVGARVDLTDADLTGADFDEVWWDDSVFTGTILVPSSRTLPAPDASGAVVTWPTPPSVGGEDGANPGECDHPSGSLFPVGVTEVRCEVLLPAILPSYGTFTVTVLPPP